MVDTDIKFGVEQVRCGKCGLVSFQPRNKPEEWACPKCGFRIEVKK